MLLLAALAPQAAADEGSPPSEPLGLVGYGAPDRNVTLTWQAPLDDGGAPIALYNVYRSLADETPQLVGSTPERLFLDDVTEAAPRTVYWYVVEAVNALGGTSPQSNSVPVVTLPPCIISDDEPPFVSVDPDCL